MTARRWAAAAVAAAAAALLLGRALAATWADWWWFTSLGVSDAWLLGVREMLSLRFIAFLFGAAFAAANLYAVRQSVVSLVLPRRLGNLEIGEEVPGRYLTGAVWLIAALMGALLSFAAPDWTRWTLARQGIAFGETEPYFGDDVGFSVYWLPFEAGVYEWAVVTAFAVGTIVLVLYALTPGLRMERGRVRLSGWVRRHFTVLGAVILVLLAWGVRLDALALPIDGSGVDGAFTASDQRLIIPANLVLSVTTLGAALVVLWAGWTAQTRLAFGAVSVVLGLALGVRGVLPAIEGRLLDPSNPELREAPYLETRASYTRRAYGLDAVEGPDSAATPLSAAALADGVPSWDPVALRRLFDRLRRTGRLVGTVGWRMDGATLRAVAVTDPARPGDPMAPWTVLEAEGAPDAEAGGMPEVRERQVAPVLVFDSAKGPIVVGDPGRHLLAPPIGTWSERLLHAWALQIPRLAGSISNEPSPVLLIRRDVRERVAAIAPFLDQGGAVMPIIVGDTVWWALDCYATAASYPLSRRIATPAGDVRYLRSAATALVNATSGRTTFILTRTPDPITRSWVALLPSLFVPRDRAPTDLVAALPPAVDGARVSAVAYALVGSRAQPAPPGRRLPAMDGGDTVITTGGPTLWATRDRSLAWSVPVLDAGDVVRGVIVATGGATPTTRWYPVRNGARWSEAVEQLAGSTRNGPAATELRTAYGRVRAIPLPDSGVALVQPRFVWPVAGAPALDGIALWSLGTVRTGRSLGALAGGPDRGPPPLDAAAKTRLAPIYERMRDALRHGDWTAFGAAFDEIAHLIGRDPRAP